MSTVSAKLPTSGVENRSFLDDLEQEIGIRYDARTADIFIDALLERLRDVEGEIRQNDDTAAARRAMIERKLADVEAWRRTVNERLERKVEELRLQIRIVSEGYDFGEAKSRTLPNGAFGYRKSPPRVEIFDMDRAVRFAEQVGATVKRTVDKRELAKAVKERQVQVNPIEVGFEVVEGQDEFFVRTEG